MVRNILVSLFLVLVLLAGGCSGGSGQIGQERPATPSDATPTTAAQPHPSPTTAAASAQGELVTVVLVSGEARYRVREQLVGLSLPSDAVGTTQAVTGKLVASPDGMIVAEGSAFRVDLSTLKSDEGRRDNFVRRNTLQTDRFPFAEFVPTEVRGLSLPLQASGQVQFQLVGYLTIRDVTQQVVWDVTARIDGDEATGQARTSFTFATFNLTKPRVPVVLGVEDEIRLEVDFHVRRGT